MAHVTIHKLFLTCFDFVTWESLQIQSTGKLQYQLHLTVNIHQKTKRNTQLV